MARKAAAIFSAVLLCGAVACAETQVEDGPLGGYELYKRATVKIVAGEFMGTGVYLGNGTILTVLHVVTQEGPGDTADGRSLMIVPEVHVLFADGRELLGRISAWSLESHLAMVVVEDTLSETMPNIQYRRTPLRLGESIFSIGHKGRELPWAFAWGRISKLPAQYFIPTNAGTFAWTDSSVIGGDSGGGVFDSEGYIIGLMNGTVEGLVGLMIPIRAACAISHLPEFIFWAIGCALPETPVPSGIK